MSKIKCDLCIYFDTKEETVEDLEQGSGRGLCRRRAPFEEVRSNDWCGEAVENAELKKVLEDLPVGPPPVGVKPKL